MKLTNEYTTLENHWMPFTPNYAFKQSPRMVVKSEGMYFWKDSGEKVLDGASGLFCVALGHCRKEIADAVYNQMNTLDYSSPFQMGQPGPFALAERLSSILPGDIDHVFFGNSGSEAVDTAMKLAVSYHHANGQPQTLQVCLERTSVSWCEHRGHFAVRYHRKTEKTFDGITLNTYHLRHTWTGEEKYKMGQPQKGAELADDLHRIANHDWRRKI